ncbi:unnamed protein product, partial [Prorocentrum cordatum]
ANVNSTMAAFTKLMEFLDLPDDAEIPTEVMAVCDSIYVSVRGFGALVNIQVGIDTEFDFVKDAMALRKAAEKTVAQSVLHDVGTTLNRNPFLSDKMDICKGTRWALSDFTEQSNFGAIINCVTDVPGWNNLYSGVLPSCVCAGLDEMTRHETKLLYDMLTNAAKGNDEEGESPDVRTSAQTLYH